MTLHIYGARYSQNGTISGPRNRQKRKVSGPRKHRQNVTISGPKNHQNNQKNLYGFSFNQNKRYDAAEMESYIYKYCYIKINLHSNIIVIWVSSSYPLDMSGLNLALTEAI